MNRERCKSIKKNGENCKAYALSDSEFCLAHDNRPEIVQKREEAARLAGTSQKLFLEVVEGKMPTITYPINIRKNRDIKKVIIRTLQEIRSGKIDLDLGRILLYGFGILTNCIEKITNLEQEQEKDKSALDRITISYVQQAELLERFGVSPKENKKNSEDRDKNSAA